MTGTINVIAGSTVNITAETDADFFQVYTYTLADGVTPISIAGATFTMGVRRTAGDPGVLFRVTSALSNTGQIVIVNGPSGQFSLWITKATLLAAPLGVWVQSLIVNMPASSGIPALSLPVWNSLSAITITPGPSR